jgi:pimeloyl-ACP methyl ester carboxylesterase
LAVEERRIEVGGLPTRYLEAGTGEPLVLLHALGESTSDWRWVLPALARTHRVYAPDLPGFGGSSKPAADYSPAFFERFAAGFLDALGLRRAAVVGNSLGGLVALRLALSEPARVGALVLVDSAGLGRSATYADRVFPPPRRKTHSPACRKVPSPSSPTAAICPTSSAPIASSPPSTSSSAIGQASNKISC